MMFNSMDTAKWIYLLPFLAIYFIVSAIMAMDPINALAEQWDGIDQQDSLAPVTRVALMISGCALIGFSAFDTAATSIPVWLSLLAIPLILSGLFGEDLVRAALDEKCDQIEAIDDDNTPTFPTPPKRPAPTTQTGSGMFDRAA
jgi:hypothetical protein